MVIYPKYNQNESKTSISRRHDVGITESELQEAQTPLNSSIRRPVIYDWERKRKSLGKVPSDIV